MVNYYMGSFCLTWLPHWRHCMVSSKKGHAGFRVRRRKRPFRLSIKAALSSESLLVHFDPAKPLILASDASSVGVGAVLSHRMKDGSDQPIAFASRTLAPAERNYSQMEREGLAIIFGIKKFHQYILTWSSFCCTF